MDRVVLEQSDGYTTASDPLFGKFRTYLLDIDNEYHRRWLREQYKLGDVMVAHKIIDSIGSDDTCENGHPAYGIQHVPTTASGRNTHGTT